MLKMMNKQKSDAQIQSLQTVRAMAFLGIFTCHAGLNQLGAWGASVFLVLSGFLMVYTYYDREVDTTWKGVAGFTLKKIGKLYPLHILMMLSALFFVVKALLENFSSYYFLRSIGQVVLNVLLLQAWIPKSAAYFSLNGVAWYLSVCVFMYLLFPYILKAMKRFSCRWNAYASIVLLFGLQFAIAFILRKVNVPVSVSDNPAKWVTYICPLFRLGDFLIGCNLGYLFLKHRLQLNRLTATIGEIIVLVMLVVSQIVYSGQYGFFSTEWFKLTVMYIPGSVLLVYLFGLKKGWLSCILTNKLTVFIGDISGYAFLVHQVVIRYLRELMSHCPHFVLGNWGVAILSFVITLGIVMLYKGVVSSGKRSL